MQNITILGSTGSIGRQVLKIIRLHPKRFKVFALIAAGNNLAQLVDQCYLFQPKYVAIADKNQAAQLSLLLAAKNLNIETVFGETAICNLVALPEVDQVVAAIVGIAGLKPTLSAIYASKRVLLANKEVLVTCGHLFMHAVDKYKAQLLPIDSEHNAIFQSLPVAAHQQLGHLKLDDFKVSEIILTGSGGPLRDIPLTQFSDITPEQACAHPIWSMGKKISIDSATMMNKGLEYIEARWLFNTTPSQLEIIIHPESIIHSMVCYEDGAILAQLGEPDMSIPIAYALAYPDRICSGAKKINFHHLKKMTFFDPDFARYPCLQLAIDACQSGQIATIALNAANEETVAIFLVKGIKFTDIAKINEQVMEKMSAIISSPTTIEEILMLDKSARKWAKHFINKV